MIELLIADDHKLVRQGLRRLLNIEDDIHVVDEAIDGEQAYQRVRYFRPNVVLMDIHMPGADGITATQRIHREHPEINVIILTMYGDEDHLFQAVKAGAKGYVHKDTSSETLLETIRAVHAGEAWLDPSIARKMLDEFRKINDPNAHEHAVYLTRREREILELVAEGQSNQDIANRLSIAEKTVRNRLSTIFSKLHVNNRTQAALKAHEEGWIDPTPDDTSDDD
ncbi:MAG: response regulator [Candidatus Bipolaricaulia bacterium]